MNSIARAIPAARGGVSGRLNIWIFSKAIEESPRPSAGFFNSIARAAAVALVSAAALALGKLPSELPGEEINEQQDFYHNYPRDSVVAHVPPGSPSSPTWLDSVQKTWDAPPLARQVAEDKFNLLMGMGAVFVPRLTDADAEPEVEILNEKGDVVAHGKTGRKYSLVPANYFVMFGSGAHSQRLVRKVDIQEGVVTPLVPDWGVLSVNVVDKNGASFRGEYEIIRLDDLEPFGRGYGQDPTLGEQLKAWSLKPGTYKIFETGQSYNTLTDFVTVRVLPGEFTRLILDEDPTSLAISGGGVASTELSRRLSSNWKYGIDVGGSGDFNVVDDKLQSSNSNQQISISLLSRLELNYRREPYELENQLLLNETVLYSSNNLLLQGNPDETILNSIFTWRVLSWLGPYARWQANTNLIPTYQAAPKTVDRHYFIVLNSDSTLSRIDSTHSSFLMQQSFSPVIVEAGVGANLHIVDVRFLESRLLTGIGFTEEARRNEAILADSTSVRQSQNPALDSLYTGIVSGHKSNTIVRQLAGTIAVPEYGPEADLDIILRIGKMATTESEVKLLAPFDRMAHPDFRPDLDWRGIVSWRLFGSFTVDYQVEYNLHWPQDPTLHIEQWTQRVLLRFSLTSR